MSEVTQLLDAIERGDEQASKQLLPIIYRDLRGLAANMLAQEPSGQTLEATALVHEAYVRLVDAEAEPKWNHRGHFFAAAAEAMRRILVEQARRKQRVKHGGEHHRVEVEDERLVCSVPSDHENTGYEPRRRASAACLTQVVTGKAEKAKRREITLSRRSC